MNADFKTKESIVLDPFDDEDLFDSSDDETSNYDASGQTISSASSSSSHIASSSPTQSPKHGRHEFFIAVAGPMFTRAGSSLQRVPYAGESFEDLVTNSGVPFVNKALALEALASACLRHHPQRALVLRRPRGFGLRTFISMWALRLNIDHNCREDPFPLLAAADESTLWSELCTHAFFVLHLDFANVQGSDLSQSLMEHIHLEVVALVQRYVVDFSIPPVSYFHGSSPTSVISNLVVNMRTVAKISERFYVIVENHEVLATRVDSPQDDDVLKLFFVDLQALLWSEIIGGLLLTSYMDDASSRLYVDRTAGSPLPEPTEWMLPYLTNPVDISHHHALQSAIGFTAQDIACLDKAMTRVAKPGSRPLLELVQEHGVRPSLFSARPRFSFNPFKEVDEQLPDVPVYPADRVLDVLGQKCGCPNRIVDHIRAHAR